MNDKWAWLILVLGMLTSSCGFMHKTPKTELVDGLYSQKTGNEKQLVYVDIDEDVLTIHAAQKNQKKIVVDTTKLFYVYPKELNEQVKYPISFDKYSFDVDVLTIPLKFRFAKKGAPPQLNTNLNGAVYFGFRTDRYTISYTTNPLRKSTRNISHYGFSMGLFTGIGNTAMTPTTTDNNIAIEYDGIVWNKGIAGIIAINNFTFGLSLGIDNLLDKNRAFWIYETKPWIGLALGLNLN